MIEYMILKIDGSIFNKSTLGLVAMLRRNNHLRVQAIYSLFSWRSVNAATCFYTRVHDAQWTAASGWRSSAESLTDARYQMAGRVMYTLPWSGRGARMV